MEGVEGSLHREDKMRRRHFELDRPGLHDEELLGEGQASLKNCGRKSRKEIGHVDC